MTEAESCAAVVKEGHGGCVALEDIRRRLCREVAGTQCPDMQAELAVSELLL